MLASWLTRRMARVEHINKLSEKYTGNPVYQPYGASGINRQMYVIEAVKINGN